jgi:uncharacterized RDD family membrane protein YckC
VGLDQTELRESRAGFWRRLFAFLVDAVIIGAIFQIIAIPAFALTNGHVQSFGVFRATICEPNSELAAGLSVPADLGVNFNRECTVGLFGLQTAHSLTVGRHNETEHSTVSWTFQLDRDGKVIQPFWLDSLILPCIFLFRWWADCGRGSPGRRLLGIRLVARRPSTSTRSEWIAPTRTAAAKRYGIFFLPFAPLFLAQLYSATIPITFIQPEFRLGPEILIIGIAVAANLVAVIAIVRRKDAFYDRLAGTEVIRVARGGPSTSRLPKKR